jgi:hypothetical protein
LLQKKGFHHHAKSLLAQLSDAQIAGPTVQIDPGIQSEIQEAVDELRKADSDIFRGVGKIVGFSGGAFGQVQSTDPTIIHINLNKIKQQVKQDLGSTYSASNPQHQDAFKEALKRSIVETISHEAAHVHDFDHENHKFPGGEGVAESKEKQMMQKLYQNKPVEIRASISKQAILTQRINPKTDRKEWVLVSKKDKRPLKYFGIDKPSKEQISKEEKRIQYFKNKSAQITGIEPSSPNGRAEPSDTYHLTGNDKGSPQSTRSQKLIQLLKKLKKHH